MRGQGRGLPLLVRAQQGSVADAPALRAPLLLPARSGRRLRSPTRRPQRRAVKMRFKETGQERGRTTWFHVVACKACGEEWPSDPALQVACIECQARPGERCIWRGQHGYTHHLSRDRQAMRAGHLTACGALTWDGRHSRHELLVCTQPVPPHTAPASTPRQAERLALF
jgi:hypothetical protein